MPGETKAASPERDDAALLAAFIRRADQKAFCKLVDRYHRMVFAVSFRGLNRNAAAAEDATQAVFILLARKASRIKPAALSGWLFKTTLQVTHSMRREEQRRRKREACMAKTSTTPTRESALEFLDRAQRDQTLHAAIARLPAKQRDALLLYYFAGLDQAAIGLRLGCSAKAVQKRIEYALAALRSRLERHSLASSLGAVFLGLEQARNLQAPVGLAARCLNAALPGAHGVAAAAAVPTHIANQILRTAMVKTWTVATLSTAGAVLVAAGIFLHVPSTPAAPAESIAAPAPPAPMIPAPRVAAAPKPAPPVAPAPTPPTDPSPAEPVVDTAPGADSTTSPVAAADPPAPENPPANPPAAAPQPPVDIGTIHAQWNLAPAQQGPIVTTRPGNDATPRRP